MNLAFRSTILTAILLLAGLSAFGQQSRVPTLKELDGENIRLEAKLNKILRGITLADLTFNSTYDQKSGYLTIRSEAVSKGTLVRLFRYSFLQQWESVVDAGDRRIVRTTKHDVQKDRVRDSVAEFDAKTDKVIFRENNPKDPTRPPRTLAASVPDDVQDIISAIFYVRTRPLSVGQKFVLSVSDSGLVYDLPVRVTARERQDSELGKKWCFRIEPEVFGTNRIIEQKGRMTIWITDDERRLPLRTRIDSQYGRIEIRIKQESLSRPRP